MVDTLYCFYTGNGEAQEGSEEEDLIEVPDVTKSIREANNILTSSGLKLKIEGSGLAVSQQPAPGTMVKKETVITVTFEPPQ